MITRAASAAAVWCVLAWAGAAPAAPAANLPGYPVMVPVRVNGELQGDVRAWISETNVYLRRPDVDRLSLPSPAASERFGEEDLVPLTSLAPAVTYSFDEANVRLDLTARELRGGGLSVVDLGRGQRPAGIVYSSDPSGFLNYSANWSQAGVGAFLEGGFSFGKGLLTSTASRGVDGRVLRGLSQLVLDDRERLVRTVVGDTFASAGGLGGGAFLGGVSVSRSFALDPYFVRYPGVGLSGAALTPSRLDVYVNGSLVKRLDVAPGPFDLKNLPVTAGGGDTRLVLRDALGQEREISSSYYVSTRTLAEGLSEFQYALGVRRTAPGGAPDYGGGLAFLGTHRLGLTDKVTGGLRLEAAGDLLSGGTTLTASLPFGEVELSAAGSRAGGAAGWAASAAWSTQRRPFGVGALFTARSDRYATLALTTQQDRPSQEASLFAGWSGPSGLGLTLHADHVRCRDGRSTDRIGAATSVRLSRALNAHLSASRGAGRTEVFASVTFSFGSGASGSLSYQSREGYSGPALDAQQALPRGNGYGYQVHADSRDVTARAQLQGPYGRYELDGSGGRPSLSVSGGVAAVGGSLHLTRTVQEGFALLRVPGAAGVRGTASNQVVGRTNAKGELLVTDLLPYYGNVLGVEDADLPLDYDVKETRRLVAPPYRGGAVVTFAARRASAVFGTVLLDDGSETMAPAHGLVRLAGGAESPIGTRGEFFLEDLEPGTHQAEVLYKGTVCRFALAVPEKKGPITKLGALRCRVASLPAPPLPVRPGGPLRGARPDPASAAPTPVTSDSKPRPAAPPGGTAYAVHLGSYRARATAGREAARLSAALHRPARVVPADLGAKGVWYRVVVGDFPSRADASSFRETLLAHPPTSVGAVTAVEDAS